MRKSGELSFLRPDGKSQVSIEYVNDKPVRIDTVVISTQHTPDVTHDEIEKQVIEKVVKKVIPAAPAGCQYPLSTSTRPAASWSAAPWATAA